MNKILLTLTTLICMNAQAKMVEMKFDYYQKQENGAPIIRIKPNGLTKAITDSKDKTKREFFDSIESKIQELEEKKVRIFGEENLDKLEESFQRFKKDGSLLYFSIREVKRGQETFPPKTHQLTFIGRDTPHLNSLSRQIREIFTEYAKTKERKKFDDFLDFYEFVSTLEQLEAQSGYITLY